MKNKLIFSLLPILLTSCSFKEPMIKIFLTSNQEVDVNQIKEDYSSSSIEVSYASPSSLYYSVIYKAAREKEYQIFVLRDEEYLPSHIKDIYKPFTDDIKNQFNKEHFYYDLDDVSYGIKLNTSNYKINNYLSFEENHDYYLSITDDSSLIITFLNEIL